MKKKVDSRIRTLVENGVKSRKRSLFVIVGDKGRDQVVNFYNILSRASTNARPKVLWCYKDKLFLSSHKKKRMKQVKKMVERGLIDPEKDDPFSLFVASTEIKYCKYIESERILGNTFGVCVLQDFEALTPNLLARTIETVEGGGIVILLLSSLKSLSSLYTMTMDVHARFRTDSHGDVVGRFNERFTLSLASCKSCIFMDDELNILPVSSHLRSVLPLPSRQGEEALTEAEKDLKELKESLHGTQPIGPLVSKSRTLDQGKAVVTFLDAVSEKTLRSTVALTASRGRGKSAALGLAVAGAIAFGYSNIFVTAPSPENLKTLFDFVVIGFDALGYKESLDYDRVQSTNPTFNKAVIRINIFRQHRQTIQYIEPQDHEKLAQAELLVIDEAAAIPLPVVKALLGPYLVFLCSTVNGYEGTGRSLSLKLFQQLREQSQKFSSGIAVSGRTFREVELSEPIRYAAGDSIEAWLHELLCLDAANHIPNIDGRLPHPTECELYYVNRDTLFSYHKASEVFLQRMMALYVASHYKNSPNDLQLMSDAPAHHLFALLGPVGDATDKLPDIFAVLQVCLEGNISEKSYLKSLTDGSQPSGDQIPWKISQQFQDSEFSKLSGARIMRIAVHPNHMRGGYGSAAVDMLVRYYEGKFSGMSELDDVDDESKPGIAEVTEAVQKASLLEEELRPRSNLPPLLVSLQDRKAEKLDYVGVSYGLTQSLHNFWQKLKFVTVYIAQPMNAITGEHSCVVLRPLNDDEVEKDKDGVGWIQRFYNDFRRRFISLLGSCFRPFPPALALSVLNPKIAFPEHNIPSPDGIFGGGTPLLTADDMHRLDKYADNLVDYHLILDLVPTIARLYFLERIPVSLSYGQTAILLSMGLQYQDISHLEEVLKLPRNQILAQFNKIMRKLNGELFKARSQTVEKSLPAEKEVHMKPHPVSVDEDLEDAAKTFKENANGNVEALLGPDGLQKFAITCSKDDFDDALQKSGGKVPKSGFLSLKGSKKRGAGVEKVRDKNSKKKFKRK